jgi:hypothetical protein
MKDDREFADSEGRTWRVTLRSRGLSGAAAEGAKLPGGYLVLRFQSDREVRLAPARDDWEQLPDDRLREILEQEASPEAEWA